MKARRTWTTGLALAHLVPVVLGFLSPVFVRRWSPLAQSLLAGSVAAVANVVFSRLVGERESVARQALTTLLLFVAIGGTVLVNETILK